MTFGHLSYMKFIRMRKVRLKKKINIKEICRGKSLFFVGKMTMYKAVNDRIIIKLDESDKSDFIICDNEQYEKNSGVVISVGENVKSVNKGDHIIFHLFDEIALPEDDLAVVREKSVLARLE